MPNIYGEIDSFNLQASKFDYGMGEGIMSRLIRFYTPNNRGLQKVIGHGGFW